MNNEGQIASTDIYYFIVLHVKSLGPLDLTGSVEPILIVKHN